MSSNYYIYTEVCVEGKWICVNNKVKDVKNNKEFISETYYNGSRSYFHETADKIEEIGNHLEHAELSDEVKGIFKDSEYFRAFSVTPNAMSSCFPEDKTLKEFCGYVQKETLFLYQTGEIDDIYECLSAEEYSELSDEQKNFYQFYEWNSADGWYVHFKEILEHFYWQKYEWETVNYGRENKYSYRLVLIIR